MSSDEERGGASPKTLKEEKKQQQKKNGTDESNLDCESGLTTYQMEEILHLPVANHECNSSLLIS